VTDRLFKVWVNPLQFLEVDEPWASTSDRQLDLVALVRFATAPGTSSDLQALVERYREISVEPVRLFAAPAEQRVLEKLVWPLRHAKVAYMFGNYLGTIAMCGMVAEMVALFLFEIGEIRVNNSLLTEDGQKGLFGSRFERLRQDRRVSILHAYGMIDDPLKAAFDLVREQRRRYLHYWSQEHDSLPGDAREAFRAAVLLTVSAFGQNVQEGKLVLNPRFVRYLERLGLVADADDDRDRGSAPDAAV
jgi:hypothetical protein